MLKHWKYPRLQRVTSLNGSPYIHYRCKNALLLLWEHRVECLQLPETELPVEALFLHVALLSHRVPPDSLVVSFYAYLSQPACARTSPLSARQARGMPGTDSRGQPAQIAIALPPIIVAILNLYLLLTIMNPRISIVRRP